MSSRRGYGNGVTHAELSTKIDSVGKRKERKEKQATRRCNLDFEYATRTGRQALARSPLPPPPSNTIARSFPPFLARFRPFSFFFSPPSRSYALRRIQLGNWPRTGLFSFLAIFSELSADPPPFPMESCIHLEPNNRRHAELHRAPFRLFDSARFSVNFVSCF